jgi:hypothetical protein
MFNQLTQRKQIPGNPAPLRIRQADHADAAALARLASLDSSRAPRGDVLLAEVGGELWAAFSLEDGHHVADPTRPSADAVLMLAQRGHQLHRDERRRSHGRGRARVRFA